MVAVGGCGVAKRLEEEVGEGSISGVGSSRAGASKEVGKEAGEIGLFEANRGEKFAGPRANFGWERCLGEFVDGSGKFGANVGEGMKVGEFDLQ